MFWQIVIDGFDNLSGQSLSKFMDDIAHNSGLDFFSLMYFEGSGILEPIRGFEGSGFIRYEELTPAVSPLIQVEWATFVCSKTGLEKCDYDDFEARFGRLLADGLTVIRCVDGQYVYVYTDDDSMKEYICQHYAAQTVEKLEPQSFEWPD